MNLLSDAVRMPAIAIIALSFVISSAGMAAPANTQSVDATAATERSFVYTITNPDGPNAIAAYELNSEKGRTHFSRRLSDWRERHRRVDRFTKPAGGQHGGDVVIRGERWQQ